MVMIAKTSILVRTYSPARSALYVALLKDRAAQWTVSDLATTLPKTGLVCAVNRDGIRAGLLMLLDDQIAVEVADRDALTVQLSSDGANILSMILDGWRSLGEEVSS